MYEKTTMPNGLRVVTETLKNTKSATILILVGAGSRYETPEINGISHFLEHMFFKGAKKYKNTKEVSEAIDGVGGEFNAFTGKEYVGYYVKVAADNINIAMDVLADMLLNSTFDPAEIDKERGVIMEEYNMYQDTPMYQIGWNFERLLYGDQPLGWDQVGTKELINTVTREQFVKYQQELYVPKNIVVSVAGNITHEQIVAMVSENMPMEDKPKSYGFKPFEGIVKDKRVHLQNKKTEQAHVSIGFPAYSEQHPDHWALKLVSVILGGNMSSRMFLGVREAKGIAYYIHTNTDDYADTGIISTTAGVDLKRVDEAIEGIIEQYEILLNDGVTEEELKKAKSYFKGKMVLKLEDSEEFSHLIAKYELLLGGAKTPDEIMAELDKVTVADIQRVASDILKPEEMRMALIGPYDDEERFEKKLKWGK